MKKTVVLLIAFSLILTSCDLVYRDNVKTIKRQSNLTTIPVSIDPAAADSFDTISISSNMMNGLDLPVQSNSENYSVSEFRGQSTISYDLQNFGKHELTIRYIKDGKTVKQEFLDYILTADEYNIALFSATMPVTFFSMLMTKESSDIDFDNTLPTVIALERANSYNWDGLYDNMYPCPFIPADKLTSSTTVSANGKNYFQDFRSDMKEYIRYLHELNPSSKFNICLNDFNSFILLDLIYENNIKEDQYTVTFFSDGQGTYAFFRKAFGSEDNAQNNSMSTFNNYVNVWNKAKANAYAGGSNIILKNKPFPYFIGLVPVILSDENIKSQWIVNRKKADTFGNTEAASKTVLNNSNVKQFNLGTHSLGFSAEETEKIKNLFKLDLDVFNEAESNGKKIMIFLGSSPKGETDLRNYLIFMKAYCGDDYLYYYKGHPGHMTAYDPDKTKMFEDIGIIDLDASIPAELFILFKPEAEMCGIQSSTFASYNHEYIPFLTSKPAASLAYYDKINAYLEPGDDTHHFKVTRKKGAGLEYSYWDASDPDSFEWVEL